MMHSSMFTPERRPGDRRSFAGQKRLFSVRFH
jgi:hypothetical protein